MPATAEPPTLNRTVQFPYAVLAVPWDILLAAGAKQIWKHGKTAVAVPTNDRVEV